MIAKLSKSIAESARKAVKISASSNQQAGGVAQLTTTVKDIEQFTKQTVTAVQQIERAAQDLATLSSELSGFTA